jgi:flagellar protein FliS
MTKEQIRSYTMQISQANTSTLAVIIYDIVITCIKEAVHVYEESGPQDDEYERSLVQAQNFLQELIAMSRMDSKVAADVMSLYLFIDKQILLSIVKRHPVNLEECLSYLERLQSSFQEICKTDYDSPIMENTQQVYAGLTYGKGYLTESIDPMGSTTRGLKA